MKEITLVMKTPEQELENQGVTPADIEDMLDELQEHVESIDMANGFSSSLLAFTSLHDEVRFFKFRLMESWWL
ncbi:hsp70-binding protein 1-like [Trifolium medium]|uniref:Hsp70-binding protein 1-like n=1 Tax=Trifolium medium TaxID=97028 RepID=A0A392QP42_9FABA|nr:hsp70-binding protein 1-like [Trifolium medium]